MATNRYPSHGNWGKDSNTGNCWLVLEVYKIVSQNAITRGKEGIQLENTGDSYEFLMPIDLLESITHDWVDYDTINSRISGIITDTGKEVGEVTSIGAGTSLKDLFSKAEEAVKSGNYATGLGELIRKGSDVTIQNKYKIDTPLAYKDSQRREYTFSIFLSTWSNAKKDVFEPVSKLRGYSCAGISGVSYIAELPYAFRIYSKPAMDFLYIDAAALTSIQPTYRAPYIDGYPTFCDLQLTFKEIPPLYKDNFTRGGLDNALTVSSSARMNSINYGLQD